MFVSRAALPGPLSGPLPGPVSSDQDCSSDTLVTCFPRLDPVLEVTVVWHSTTLTYSNRCRHAHVHFNSNLERTYSVYLWTRHAVTQTECPHFYIYPYDYVRLSEKEQYCCWPVFLTFECSISFPLSFSLPFSFFLSSS